MKGLKLITLTTTAVLAISANAMAMTSGYSSYENASSKQGGTYVISNEGNLFTYSSNGEIKQVLLNCGDWQVNTDCDDNTVEPEVPVEPEKPVDPEVPVEPEKPVDPEVPVEPEKPVEPEIPVVPEIPVEPEVPVDPETPTNPGNNVSAYAQEVVNLVNAERAKEGLTSLSIDMDAMEAAQVRASEIKTSFSHSRPDGRTCYSALDEAGAKYSGAGENIAMGQKTPQQVVTDWMNSEGHRKNIMNKNFKYIGVGVEGTAWTQFFTY